MVQGEESTWRPVTSGIPQGSVLGPLLFVIFINDLPDCVTSDAYLFADDTKIFRIIGNDSDRDELQQDLHILDEWSKKWLLKFHPKKCKYMTIGKDDGQFKYTLQGQQLQKVQEEKDIGVIIDDKLSFEGHISEKVNKATHMFGLLRRTFQCLDQKIFISLYKTLVRTHLDYASLVWAPYKTKDIEILENVQRRCTRQLPYLKDVPYEERLKQLKLPTLSYRHWRGDLIEVYKMLHGFYDKEASSILKLWTDVAQRRAARGHPLRVYLQRSSKPIRQKSFGIRIVTAWNNLPEEVAKAPSINTFKNRLDKYWKDQEILYNYKAVLDTTVTRIGSELLMESQQAIDETPEDKNDADQGRGSADKTHQTRSITESPA